MNQPIASTTDITSEADDIHLGYMGRGELIESLNALIEAERAGTRTALALRDADTRQDVRTFVRTFHAEEAHWCSQLVEAVRKLGGNPSERCSEAYERSMAIGDPIDRLAFAGFGQRWLQRKLDCLLPVIRDEPLRVLLRSIRDGHQQTVGRIRQLVMPH